MKVLVIPDIHMKPWIFDQAEALLKTQVADQAVCLMDLADEWHMQRRLTLYEQIYDRAISFAKTFPNTLWCYGNHDVSYLWGKLETGYSPYAEQTVIAKLRELKEALVDPSNLAFVQKIDHILFSHGGLTSEYVMQLDENLIHCEMEEVLYAVNHAPVERLWFDDSPLWVRPQYRKVEAFRKERFLQVVGHTPVPTISEKNGFISTDVFSITPSGQPIGDEQFLLIDSITKKYSKISGKGSNDT